MHDLDGALQLLHFAFRRVIHEPDAILARRGLGRVHHRLLFFIRTRGPLSSAELGEILGVSKQAIHGPLRELIAQKLVLVKASEVDRRQRLLSLGVRGRELEEKISGIQRELFAKAFVAAGPKGEAGFVAVMRALTE